MRRRPSCTPAASAASSADGEAYGPIGKPTSYPDPGRPNDTDKVLVTGTWADHGQYLQATAPGHVRLNFSARDLYLVAGPDSAPLQVTVTVDGAAVPVSQRGPDLAATGLDITGQQLYHVLQEQGGGRHLIDIAVPAGFRLYTFTFG